MRCYIRDFPVVVPFAGASDFRLDDREDISTAESDRAQAFRWRWRRWNFGVTTGVLFSPALEQQLSRGFSIVVIPVVVAGAVIYKKKKVSYPNASCLLPSLFIYLIFQRFKGNQTNPCKDLDKIH